MASAYLLSSKEEKHTSDDEAQDETQQKRPSKPLTEEEKKQLTLRHVSGKTWEDKTLLDWPQSLNFAFSFPFRAFIRFLDDFRIWCGDLAPDLTERQLAAEFEDYPSFNMARIIRDCKTKHSKGYGFIRFVFPSVTFSELFLVLTFFSFGSAEDFLRAFREKNGKYVGSRPIRLRKCKWQNRSYQTAKRKEDRVLS